MVCHGWPRNARATGTADQFANYVDNARLFTANSLPKRALLTDPWVFGSARQGGAVPAEGEHGQGDECFRGAESECDPG